jgi:putative oxidoreductase
MNEFVSNVLRRYSQNRTVARSVSDLGPLMLRLTLGIVFISSGWGKLNDLDKVGEFFAELGIVAPALNAVVVACTECFGGLAVLLGLATRLSALPLAITMVVAIVTALLPDSAGVVELVASSEFAYLVMFLTLVMIGPGRWSVDHIVLRRLFMRNHESAPRIMAASGAN